MRYRLLGTSGLRVSELCLGTMTFGDDWGWGASREESRQIFDAFVVAGGNFVDTASNYTNGSSEEIVGESIREDRQRFVVATKYSLNTRQDDPNAGGNSRKNMMQSVERSLRRLNTDYIDLLWLHMWDFMTPVEEVMRGLDDLVRSGNVLYVGFSDSPAWVVSQAAMLGRLRGWSPPVAVQLPYSLLTRDAERDLFPMAASLGLTVLCWDLLDSGVLTGKYETEGTEPRRYDAPTISEARRHVVRCVMDVAREIGATPAQTAIAWVLSRRASPSLIPILGARTEAQLRENIAALDITLDDEHRERLNAVSAIDLGFPQGFLTSDHIHSLINGNTYPLIDRREAALTF